MADKHRNQEEARRQAAKGSSQVRDIKHTGISKGETSLHHSSPGGESTACGKCGAQIEELENTLKDLKIQLENMEEKKDDEERKRIKENISLRNQILEKDEEIKKTKEHASVLKEKETEFNSLKTKMREQQDKYDSTLKEREENIIRLQDDMRRKNKEHASILKENEDKIHSLETDKRCSVEMVNMQDRCRTLQKQLEAEQKTAIEAMLRLSEVLPDKLQHNPNIVDLSDGNRPNKLAERFSELYDNQWTDAFDQMEPDGRQESVMFEILMTIYKTCSDFSTTKMIQIREAFGLKDGQTLPDDLEFKIVSNRKKNALQLLPTIEVKARTSLCSLFQTEQWPSVLESETMEKYVNECTKLCWLMTVQSPPVVLMTDACRQDQTFNKDIFKAYTTSGQYVDFVVWPALLIHEGGPLLSKWNAQGKD